jgi:hypothetical protein
MLIKTLRKRGLWVALIGLSPPFEGERAILIMTAVAGRITLGRGFFSAEVQKNARKRNMFTPESQKPWREE